MISLFFIYGLAFSLLGWTILIYPKKHSTFGLTDALPFLAAFGLIHGLNEWCDMAFYIIAPERPHWLAVIRLLLLPLSFACLLFFGLQGMTARHKYYAYLRWLTIGLFLAWALITMNSSKPFISGDIWGRYLLAFPGTLLAAYALISQLPTIRQLKIIAVHRALQLAAAAFLLYGFLAGVIVPEASFYPASILNYPTFSEVTGLPVQLFRAICALVMTGSLLQVLKVFDLEASRGQEMAKDLARIVENSLNEIYICASDDFTILQANQSALTNLGYTLDDIQQLTAIDLNKEYSLDSFETLVAPLHSGQRKKIELSANHQRKDGSIYPVEVHMWPATYGSTPVFVAFVRDISERQQNEQKMLDREKRYRTLLEGVTDGIFVHTINNDGSTGQFIEVNTAACKCLGYTRGELLGMGPEDIDLPGAGDAVSFANILAASQDITFEQVHVAKDGRHIPVEIHAQAFTLDEKTAIIAIARNISERNQAERDLRRTTEQLSVLLESLPVVPFACEADGDYRLTYVSSAIKEVTGYRPELFSEDPSFWAEHIHENDRQGVFPSQPEKAPAAKSCFEYRFQVADGSFRWFSDTRRLVSTTGNGPWQMVGVWQDITAEKKWQQESELRLQQLIQADKLAALGEVVAGVAHEINNPVSFITYNLPLLADTWRMFRPLIDDYTTAHPGAELEGYSIDQLCQEMVEMIEAINVGAERIQKVVINLKDFARMDEGVYKTAVQMNEVIQRALTIIGAQVRKRVAQVQLEVASDLPTIEGHSQKLEQVIINLVLNAALAVPKKETGLIMIRSRYLAWCHTVLVEVEDNGIGINPPDMERIFEPFFSSRRTEGGTGLGLSVSYGLIQEHHGHIGVLSRPGMGSKFTLFLPVRQDQEETRLSPTLFCVDDDPVVLNMLAAYFIKMQDMSFVTSSDPEAVLEYLADHPEVDVVLTDIMMPGINGWELLTLIKERFPLVAVVLTSGSIETLHAQPAGAPAPDALVPKPFDMKNLVKKIQTIGRQRL